MSTPSNPSVPANDSLQRLDRRGFLTRLGSGLLVATGGSVLSAAAFAEELERTATVRTPWQTEGPFYPRQLPLDRDNDLVIVSNNITPAVGEVTHLSGRILDARGNPVKGAVVEIWQVDHHGVYLHNGSDNYGGRDKNFQGWGRFETGSTGEYRFRTIKPVPYPGRTPHIHVKVKQNNQELLTTQWYIKGHPQNARDGVLGGIRDTRQRASVQSDFVPIPARKSANWPPASTSCSAKRRAKAATSAARPRDLAGAAEAAEAARDAPGKPRKCASQLRQRSSRNDNGRRTP
jgi:protocatechuate 3,4-dioxygenase beta subunit